MLFLIAFSLLLSLVRCQRHGSTNAWHILDNNECAHNPAGPLNPHPWQTQCLPEVDDESIRAGIDSPWSMPPICIRAKDPIAEPSKLCTYTVSNLRGENGMSIITKPTVAAGLAGILQHPDISWLENQRRTRFLVDPRRPYEIKEIPGKGFGVIATDLIRENTTVMLELPVVLKIADPSPWNHPGAMPLMQQAAKRLPRHDQNRLLSMARQGRGYILDDIFRTNSFFVTVEGVKHAAVYPEIARINHECKPNCIIRYSSQTLALEIVAYRDIQPGEEVTLSYLPLNLPYHQRVNLIKGWGFTCNCRFCTDAESRAASDRRRDGIDGILHGVKHPQNVSREKIHLAVAKLEEIVEEEGLSAQLGDLLYLVADACLAARDLKLAREIGEKALKAQKHYAGVDNERSYEVMRLLELVDTIEQASGE